MGENVLDLLPPMIVGLAFIYMIGAVITAVLEWRRRADGLRARTDLLNRVLDKFGSSRDFIEFSDSPDGKRLLESLGSEENGVGARILSAVQRGVVLTVVGIGVLLLSLAVVAAAMQEFLRIFGGVLVALGLGYLGSSALSFRIARSMGLVSHRSTPLAKSEARV